MPSPRTTRSMRVAGLDTLRALAIVAVMLYHFSIQGLVPPPLNAFAAVGWIGVDLFFVLSGFLIGTQLLRPFAAGTRPSLADFYLRRSLRVLPAFFVVLLLYCFVPAWSDGSGLYAPWQYATFTWNLLLLHFPDQRAFSHIWSLCVEEHFYLLLPALLLLIRTPLTRRSTMLLLAGLLCAGVALRACLLWNVVLPATSDDGPGLLTMRFLYYPTYTRLDGLVVGVALAAWSVFQPEAWQRATNRAHFTGVAGLLLLLAALWTCKWNYVDADRPASILFAFPLLALGFGCLLLSASSSQGWLRRRIPGTAPLATLAFSLYLTHKAVAHMLHHALPNVAAQHPWPMLLLCFAGSAATASLLFLTVEQPFLRLRSRWLDNRAAAASTITQASLDPAL